ncbi:MAG: HAMP domain-containing protein, partial [Burkholderiaceae bacterium]
MGFDDLKIGTRIGISFTAVLALSLCGMAAGALQLGELGDPSKLEAVVAANRTAALAADVASARMLMLTAGLLAVAAGVGGALWLRWSTAQPLEQAVLIADTVTSGDLSQEFESDRGGDFGRLLRGLGAMEDKLTDVVTEIRSTSDAIMVASDQIASG